MPETTFTSPHTNVQLKRVMKMSESTFLLPHFPASATKPSTFTKLPYRGSQKVEEAEVWPGNAQEAATREQSLTASPNSAAAKGRVSASWSPGCTLGSGPAISVTRMSWSNSPFQPQTTFPLSLLLCRLCFCQTRWLQGVGGGTGRRNGAVPHLCSWAGAEPCFWQHWHLYPD